MRASDVPTENFAASPARRHAGARSSRHAAPPRRRRPGLLLAALVAGGLAAGISGLQGTPAASAQARSVLAAQQTDLRQDEPVLPRTSITLAEAQARLRDVAASRAARADEQARAAAAAAAAATPPRPECVLPVAGAQLSSTFEMRWGVMHWGIDLAAPMRTPEYAARDGVVLEAGAVNGFGLAVYLLHENGDVSVYGHMDSFSVKPGQYVEAGDKIALLGMQGESTGPHLHLEVHKGGIDGKRVDPIPWLRACGVDI